MSKILLLVETAGNAVDINYAEKLLQFNGFKVKSFPCNEDNFAEISAESTHEEVNV